MSKPPTMEETGERLSIQVLFVSNFYWDITDLQCCVSFRCTAKCLFKFLKLKITGYKFSDEPKPIHFKKLHTPYRKKAGRKYTDKLTLAISSRR